jgi:hypothetical protein
MKNIKAILNLASVGVLIFIIYYQKEEIKSLKENISTLTTINDSLLNKQQLNLKNK